MISSAISHRGVEAIAPPAHTPDHDQIGHVVQLYTDDAFLIDVMSRFIGRALAAGDAAVVLATKAHQSQLEKQLLARGLKTARAASQGRYIFLDATEMLPKVLVNGTVDAQRFTGLICETLTRTRRAMDGGLSDHLDNKAPRPIAVFGELVAMLWAAGKPLEAIRVEQLWNALAKDHCFSLLCAYPLTGFTDERHTEPFLTMCGHHSSVVPSEGFMDLGSEAERLRSVAQLQQRAQVLESKVALRQSEQRFRVLVDTVQDYAIFMLDPAGKVCSWNTGAERIKGYKPHEILGKHFSCFYPEEEVLNGKPNWELVIAAKDGRFEDEGWRLRKDGTRFWANVIITALKDDAGKLIGFAKVTRDVSEKMEAQKALQKEVTERREAQRQLHNSERSLRQLSLHLLRTQDEERRRIGRDLHDSLGQYLAVLKMKLDSVASFTGQEKTATAREIEECIRLTEDSIKEVRTVSYLLYPPMLEEMGLESAIPWYLDGFSARSGISTAFDIEPGFGRLPRDSELALFRVLQESLTNVHRHSGSKTAHVRLLMRDGMAVLEVEDTGKGIAPELLEQSGQDWMGALGVGVRGMNERMRQLGGRLELTSQDRGTKLSAIIPTLSSSS
jgi:PAS domain S-box-containing protein